MTRITLLCLAIATVSLTLAPAAHADALQDQLLAGARAVRADAYVFRRTLAIERTGAARQVRVEQYDPRRPTPARWALVNIGGRVPTAKELAETRKQRRGPVPSYADLARWIGAPATRAPAPPGYVLYRFARLPKGALKLGPADVSGNMGAEALVNVKGARPFVERVRWTANKPFRMMLVASVRSMEITGRYRLSADGQPVPADLSSQTPGSLFGKSGQLRTSATYDGFQSAR